ncbi:MAG: CCA tRNA nucleotidyltransferase, partial [Alphaproteobacteria bacterium]
AILGRKLGDIDLATNLPPERVMETLSQQGLKTVPTGLAHGTITAVADHVGYEITTLRRDVETDGRHAQVAFTDDWRIDAARRDFTFNALYLDAEGKLYDYFFGVEDAVAGRVRFIGDAHARIQEDVLRILRFFRFYAWFGQGAPDAEGLAACRELANLIPRLSAERVAREILKLLAAENPLPAWRLMHENGVLPHVAPEARDLAHLEALVQNEQQQNEPPDALVRFASLLPEDELIAASIAARLKLSNRDGDKLRALAKLPGLLRDDFGSAGLRRLLYAYGAENCRASVFLAGQHIAQSLATITAWENPVFPIKGEDIVKAGAPAGPQIGEILRAVEKWWIDKDFRPDRSACLAQIKQSEKNP